MIQTLVWESSDHLHMRELALSLENAEDIFRVDPRTGQLIETLVLHEHSCPGDPCRCKPQMYVATEPPLVTPKSPDLSHVHGPSQIP